MYKLHLKHTSMQLSEWKYFKSAAIRRVSYAPPDTIEVIWQADTPWESCTFPVRQWMTSDINNPLISHCLLFTMPPKRDGVSSWPVIMGREQKTRRGAHLILIRQRHNMKGKWDCGEGFVLHTWRAYQIKMSSATVWNGCMTSLAVSGTYVQLVPDLRSSCTEGSVAEVSACPTDEMCNVEWQSSKVFWRECRWRGSSRQPDSW